MHFTMVHSIWSVSLISVSNMYNHIIEDWWRHQGIWDREQASGILVENFDGETALYLDATDRWWNNLNNAQKQKVYNNFFTEE